MKSSFRQDWPVYLIAGSLFIVISIQGISWLRHQPDAPMSSPAPDHWVAPSLLTDNRLSDAQREQVIYGEDLVKNTARYFGPQGTVLQISNGMNCQNCHLMAGKKAWGNNYGAVYSTYPKFRERNGHVEGVAERVNDCFERSLNGKPIDTSGKEMQAIVAYIRWLGQDVKKGELLRGSGITELPFLNRAADPVNGAQVYAAKCSSCHGAGGQGMKEEAGYGYVYPPLWGEHSYNTGAGLFRLSRFAGYVKDNMPFNQSTHQLPALTDEEAWDVAAFVNAQPRPHKDLSKDWPVITKKPVDHPFGPYADGFSEQQHKYGPFQPIAAARKIQAAKILPLHPSHTSVIK